VTYACATTAEARAARRAGLRASLIGLAGANGVPDGTLVSFGLAGSLNGLRAGEVIDAVRIVDERGDTLWEGPGLDVAGACRVTVLASDRIVDDPSERRRLHELTGADAIDMESGVLARTGRLRGIVRAVSDTPERPLGALAGAVTPRGQYAWGGLARAFVESPAHFVRSARDAKLALRKLEHACDKLSQGGGDARG
jgi:hypothetical protein